MPITKKQLFAAADALVADGIGPTLDPIRAKLGVATAPPTDAIVETNSMNAWKADHAAKRQLGGESVPTAIVERINQFSNELWATALAQANELIAPERKAMQIAHTEFETRQRQGQSDAQASHAQLIAANERAAVALARVDELDETVAHLRVALKQVNEQNHELLAAIKSTVGIVNEPSHGVRITTIF
jgi:Plasmid replication region DNA-binding N-term